MDHITSVTGGGIDEQYKFDGMGRRVGVTTAGAEKKFLIAPNLGDGYESPQAVTDGTGNLIARYVYAGEHPIDESFQGIFGMSVFCGATTELSKA